MQQHSIDLEMREAVKNVKFSVGDIDAILGLPNISAMVPFDDLAVEFLNSLSRILLSSNEAKAYPDVFTLGFWIRKASVLALKERFNNVSGDIKVGKGVVFHIAPSNVPVNYAYSLISGILTGNANIVRIPSKEFPQVTIINRAINEALNKYPEMKPYICLVRYGRERKVNDFFSRLADVRIIWGGDNTITELRKSLLNPRAGEVTFADRYSLAVINSDRYLELENKERFAEAFYNDTYLSDQNACTSPRLIVWIGSEKEKAKNIFWKYEHDLVKKKYTFQPIMGINKLTSSYLAASTRNNIKIEDRKDNYIVRVNVSEVTSELMELKDNSGYFFEYDCENILEIRDFCNNTRCQTIGYLGAKEDIIPLLESGIKGVDRVVSVGKTMDFDFIWDGYNLVERLTRTIKINI
ncbi:hypothetical protein NSB25_09260 [Acetatifactor muris]|uniref:Acyl-CoA reductase (LuxC) n=1 Tax=Acetatifactor muris TaxID=879566 RepID=A0A2K4ZA90_9FIRM|nr:acyl-CoA reductase [Acetatifactor muris]MCR2047466.1 hypothetical protein [Acetatifactor muris]SOY27361.1 Acyl-CoA reductase (LuxC) [Acetatifactor muris]